MVPPPWEATSSITTAIQVAGPIYLASVREAIEAGQRAAALHEPVVHVLPMRGERRIKQRDDHLRR